jgi:O-antigen ligase
MMQNVLERHWAYIFSLVGPLAYFSVYALWFPLLLIIICNFSRVTIHFNTDGLWSLSGYAPYFMLPLLGIVSATWALVPSDAISTGMKFGGYFIIAILVGFVLCRTTKEEKRKIYQSTAIGLLITFPICLLDILLDGSISAPFKSSLYAPDIYNRGTAITVCLIFPLAVGLSRFFNKWLVFGFLVLCLGMIFGLFMEASKLAVIISAIIFITVKWQPRLFWPVVVIPLLIAFAFPFLFLTTFSEAHQCQLTNLKASAMHRVMIYQFGAKNVMENPWFGWGMDASRSIPGGSKEIEKISCKNPDGLTTEISFGDNLPLHPHNAGLQIWLELGVFGSVLLIVSVLLLIKRFEEELNSDNGRAVLAATFCSAYIIYSISFGLWQSWLMFSMILTGGLVVTLDTRERSKLSTTNI